MTVFDLKKGDRAVVVAVEAEAALKERLRILNVTANRYITVLKVSPFRKTFLLGAGSAAVALRREVALAIEVSQA